MAYFFKLPKINELNPIQQSAVDSIHPIKVVGGPGTGKSVVSLWRHLRNHSIGRKRSLLLTYTKTLEAFLAGSALGLNAKQEFLAGSALGLNVKASENISRTKYWAANPTQHYDEIIVDEAQDVNLNYYLTINSHSDNLCYSLDEFQSVFLTENELKELKNGLKELLPNNKEFFLDKNYRNTYEIINFTKALFPHRILGEANTNGPKPVVLISNNNTTRYNGLISVIKQFRSENHNIAVFAPKRIEVQQISNLLTTANISHSSFVGTDEQVPQIDNVHVTTFKSAKGLEFDTVIIPDFDRMQNNLINLHITKESDYFVVLTRSRRNLFLICSQLPAFLTKSDAQKQTYSVENLK
ncbi:MAG: hypothetical protein AMXMBFR48_21420 [Ignavibacteriales bacterium]